MQDYDKIDNKLLNSKGFDTYVKKLENVFDFHISSSKMIVIKNYVSNRNNIIFPKKVFN